jgi:hypothetical protein
MCFLVNSDSIEPTQVEDQVAILPSETMCAIAVTS